MKLQTVAGVKNHNASPGFELCFKDNVTAKSLTMPTKRPTARPDNEEVQALLQYVWLKVQENQKSLQAAFRFLDTSGRGKLRKSEFA